MISNRLGHNEMIYITSCIHRDAVMSSRLHPFLAWNIYIDQLSRRIESLQDSITSLVAAGIPGGQFYYYY